MPTAIGQALWPSGTTGRAGYFVTGVSLFAVKFVIDRTIAGRFGHGWTPLNYLIWPDGETVRVWQLPPADRDMAIALLVASLPFIAIGMILTLRRLRDAGLPLVLALLFFVPLVNLLVILALCLIPTKPPPMVVTSGTTLARRARAVHRRMAGESSPVAFGIASVASVVLTVGLVLLAANALQSYGFGVFVAAPFAQGWLAAVLYGLTRRRSVGQCLGVAAFSLMSSGLILLGFALEGAICILMAAPIALTLSLLGGLVGFAVQARPWANDYAPALTLGLVVVLPGLIAAEASTTRELTVRAVVTTVEVNASPATVWRQVVAFPPLAAPDDLMFQTGLAYPVRAEIVGTGVGAVRRCVFSTGAFVEPITIWDEPRCLAFDVTEQPVPMEELSPFHIHPPHLDYFLVSRRGQFKLTELPGGRTRLEGTTWYTNRMWPADYWGVWSDFIIGRIHRRVLDHVRDLAEKETTS